METTDELNFLTTLLPFAGILFIIAVGVVFLNLNFHKNLYQQKLEREELKNRHHQDLLSSTIVAQETERKRIAQDLHDELGAALSIARMHIVQLEQKCEDKHIQPALQNIQTITESALASMRRISHELMPPVLEAFGLVKTLESVANHANSAGEISIEVNAIDIPRLSWPVELGIYRISMELINNTIKHAAATQINIDLQFHEGSLLFQYTDNGIGLSETSNHHGLGFKNIEARANILNATTCYDKKEIPGFSMSLHVPIIV